MAGVERKVTAGTIGAYLGGLGTTVLGQLAAGGTVAGALAPGAVAGIGPASVAFLVAWLVRHTPRGLADQVRRLVRSTVRDEVARQLAADTASIPTAPRSTSARHRPGAR